MLGIRFIAADSVPNKLSACDEDISSLVDFVVESGLFGVIIVA